MAYFCFTAKQQPCFETTQQPRPRRMTPALNCKRSTDPSATSLRPLGRGTPQQIQVLYYIPPPMALNLCSEYWIQPLRSFVHLHPNIEKDLVYICCVSHIFLQLPPHSYGGRAPILLFAFLPDYRRYTFLYSKQKPWLKTWSFFVGLHKTQKSKQQNVQTGLSNYCLQSASDLVDHFLLHFGWGR